MRRTVLTGGVAVAIGVLAIAGMAARTRAQGAQPAGPKAPAKIAGQWKFNKDLSAAPGDTTTVTSGPRAPGGAGPGGGYAPGGGFGPGGGGLGGFGGGGGYGGGGYGGGSGGGARVANLSSEKTLQLHALMRDINQPPAILNIVTGSPVVTLTTDEGVVRKFTANGKKEKVDFTSADVETTTRWDQDALTQEMKVGDVKVTRTFQTTEQGNQLVITVTTENGGRLQPTLKKYVYDRN